MSTAYANYLKENLPKHLKVREISRHFVELLTEVPLTAADADYLVDIGLGFCSCHWDAIPYAGRWNPGAQQLGHIICRREHTGK
jgi:hypothetical protein